MDVYNIVGVTFVNKQKTKQRCKISELNRTVRESLNI